MSVRNMVSSMEEFVKNHIPHQLHNVPMDVREEFKDTEFDCTECGGDLMPFNMTEGVCVQCGHVEELAGAEWNSSKLDEEDLFVAESSEIGGEDD